MQKVITQNIECQKVLRLGMGVLDNSISTVYLGNTKRLRALIMVNMGSQIQLVNTTLTNSGNWFNYWAT